MNRTLVLLIILASVSFSSMLLTVDVERSGVTSVVLSLEGEDSASVPLPSDASNFRIVGGSYEISNGTALITSGQSGFTTFSFSSSALTVKNAGRWTLSFTSPSDSKVVVFMPAHSILLSSSPKPAKVSADESRASLEFPGGHASLEYSLSDVPEQEQGDSSPLLFAALILGLAIVAAAYLLRSRPVKKPKEAQPSLGLTPGKKEMMETFNENDRTIVNYLLAREGKSRRNDLERKTGISKSSLAKAINRLEKRKIIEIDRTSTTHFVKLSEYFLKL